MVLSPEQSLHRCGLRQVELEAVRPGGDGGGEELRLGAAVLPLRLRVDQAVVEFLQGFFAPPNPDEGDGELINWADEEGSDVVGDDGPLAADEEADSGAAESPSLIRILQFRKFFLCC